MEHVGPGQTKSRGLLHQHVSMGQFDLTRIAPSGALLPFVESYWIVAWDLTGKAPYEQANLPHPSVNIAIDPQGETGVFGVQTGIWTYRLAGAGRVFGIKFRPGGFHVFYGMPLDALTDKSVPIEAVFVAADSPALEKRLMTLNDPAGLADDIEKLLLALRPERGAQAAEVQRLVDLIRDTPEIMRVEDLSAQCGLGIRGVQRLFRTYIGVGPKWVIDRYRVLAAVDALNGGAPLSLTELAHDLGYFDQAHFSRTFRALTGHPPSHFRPSTG